MSKGLRLLSHCRKLICLFTLSYSQALASQNLIVVTENHPPVQFEREGQVVGPSTEIVKEVLRLSGFAADIKIMPWARAYNMVQETPNTLIYSMLRTTSRETMFYWIGAVAQHKGALLALHSRQELVASTLEDAKQYLVGTVRHTYAHDFLLKQGFSEDKNLFLVATLDEEVNLFINKRFDFILSDPDTIAFKLQEVGLVDADLKVITWIPQLNMDLYLAANLQSNIKWLEKLQSSMDKFKKTAEYKALYERNSRH
jgi:polar amino acid transport system substrate-binding protein